MLLEHNILGHCPGGWCDYLVQFSEVLVVLLLADGFIFLVTLIPPLFSWKNKKPDSRKRIFFAAFACLTFYFWLAVLAIHSLYCFGFLAHAGPCNSSTSIGTSSSARVSQLTSDPVLDSPTNNNLAVLGPQENDSLGSRLLPPINLLDGEEVSIPNMTNMSLAMAGALSQDNTMEKCITNTENSLKNITLVNFLIILILIIVVAANVNEGEVTSFIPSITQIVWSRMFSDQSHNSALANMPSSRSKESFHFYNFEKNHCRLCSRQLNIYCSGY